MNNFDVGIISELNKQAMSPSVKQVLITLGSGGVGTIGGGLLGGSLGALGGGITESIYGDGSFMDGVTKGARWGGGLGAVGGGLGMGTLGNLLAGKMYGLQQNGLAAVFRVGTGLAGAGAILGAGAAPLITPFMENN